MKLFIPSSIQTQKKKYIMKRIILHNTIIKIEFKIDKQIGYNSMNSRQVKALHQNIVLVDIIDINKYIVSGSSGHNYNVRIDSHYNYFCSCPDYQNRQNKCKHIYFVFLKILKDDTLKDETQKDDTLKDKNKEADDNLIESQKQNYALFNRKKCITETDKLKIKGLDDLCSICFEENDNGMDSTFCGSCFRCLHHACYLEWKKKSNNSKCIFCKLNF
jgi:hypothetical protein